MSEFKYRSEAIFSAPGDPSRGRMTIIVEGPDEDKVDEAFKEWMELMLSDE